MKITKYLIPKIFLVLVQLWDKFYTWGWDYLNFWKRTRRGRRARYVMDTGRLHFINTWRIVGRVLY